jgi:hypothetical protein
MLFLLVTGCASTLPSLGQIGAPLGGSVTEKRAECSAPDVAPRLHFAKVSDLSWMSASERVLLATPDISGTSGADTQALDRFAIDGAMRRIAPLGLEAAGAPALAMRLRSAPPIETLGDLQRAWTSVEDMERELPEGTRGHHVLAVLERGMRHALDRGFTDARCAYVVGHGTLESELAAAAIDAGAPRSRVVEANVDLLAQMADFARESEPRVG